MFRGVNFYWLEFGRLELTTQQLVNKTGTYALPMHSALWLTRSFEIS